MPGLILLCFQAEVRRVRFGIGGLARRDCLYHVNSDRNTVVLRDELPMYLSEHL